MQVYGRPQEGKRVKGYLILQEVVTCLGPPLKPMATIAIRDEKVVVDWGFPRPYVLVSVDPDTIQYCSGMPDTDGDEIASGDFIQQHDGAFVGLVEYRTASNGTKEFYVRWASADENGTRRFCSGQRLSEVYIGNGRPVIVGNRWDNPKLYAEICGEKEGGTR